MGSAHAGSLIYHSRNEDALLCHTFEQALSVRLTLSERDEGGCRPRVIQATSCFTTSITPPGFIRPENLWSGAPFTGIIIHTSCPVHVGISLRFTRVGGGPGRRMWKGGCGFQTACRVEGVQLVHISKLLRAGEAEVIWVVYHSCIYGVLVSTNEHED